MSIARIQQREEQRYRLQQPGPLFSGQYGDWSGMAIYPIQPKTPPKRRQPRHR